MTGGGEPGPGSARKDMGPMPGTDDLAVFRARERRRTFSSSFGIETVLWPKAAKQGWQVLPWDRHNGGWLRGEVAQNRGGGKQLVVRTAYKYEDAKKNGE